MNNIGLSCKKIALFSSFFSTSEVPEYIYYYLDEIRKNVDFLVYLTTDEKKLCERDLLTLAKYVDKIELVKNDGFDFGMWQKALLKYDVLGKYDELYLINDSAVCFNSLTPFFNWHEQVSADVTGMSVSLEIHKHIQSFFICVKSKALKSVVNYLIGADFSSKSYEQIIESGELGLSLFLQKQGYKIKGYYETGNNNLRNPTHTHCIDAIEFGVPLIKKKLLTNYIEDLIKNLIKRRGVWSHNAIIKEIRKHSQYKQRN